MCVKNCICIYIYCYYYYLNISDLAFRPRLPQLTWIHNHVWKIKLETTGNEFGWLLYLVRKFKLSNWHFPTSGVNKDGSEPPVTSELVLCAPGTPGSPGSMLFSLSPHYWRRTSLMVVDYHPRSHRLPTACHICIWLLQSSCQNPNGYNWFTSPTALTFVVNSTFGMCFLKITPEMFQICQDPRRSTCHHGWGLPEMGVPQ